MTMILAASSDPSNWLVSQPQLVFVAIAGAAWLFKMIKSAADARRQPEDGPAKPGARASLAEVAGEKEERTRRVREDIRRTIAERRRGAATPASVSEEEWDSPPAAPVLPLPMRAAAAPALQPIAVLAAGKQLPSAGGLWLEELRTRESVRRAILVREILGPPVALR